MAELEPASSSDCCSAEAQQDCCEAKGDCCGEDHDSGCGCSAGATNEI
jgi:hypothetical protein